MHMTATLTKWYEERGRHEIFAGGKNVNLGSKEHSLVLDPEAVAAGIQTDLDEQGIAKNARQEKLAARAAAKEANGNGAAHGANGANGTNGTNGANGKSGKDAAYDQQMAALYRQHVLKEEAPPVVQIQGLKSSKQDDLVGVS
jgi:hypothetical protein